MRERKNVKFRVDMYEDTKLKIIDTKPERDLIHYIWTRLVILAGKVNGEGELYISKNIPYTMETLAIEFNRTPEQVKLALEILIELEMVEFSENNIYRVKNFAKHQNIKVKEKEQLKAEENIGKEKEKAKEEFKDKTDNNKEIYCKNVIDNNKEICCKDIIDNNEANSENVIDKSEVKSTINDNMYIINKEISKDTSKANINTSNGKIKDYLVNKIYTPLEIKKNKRKKKGGGFNITDRDIEDKEICSFIQGDNIPLGKGQRVVGEWSFL